MLRFAVAYDEIAPLLFRSSLSEGSVVSYTSLRALEPLLRSRSAEGGLVIRSPLTALSVALRIFFEFMLSPEASKGLISLILSSSRKV